MSVVVIALIVAVIAMILAIVLKTAIASASVTANPIDLRINSGRGPEIGSRVISNVISQIDIVIDLGIGLVPRIVNRIGPQEIKWIQRHFNVTRRKRRRRMLTFALVLIFRRKRDSRVESTPPHTDWLPLHLRNRPASPQFSFRNQSIALSEQLHHGLLLLHLLLRHAIIRMKATSTTITRTREIGVFSLKDPSQKLFGIPVVLYIQPCVDLLPYHLLSQSSLLRLFFRHLVVSTVILLMYVICRSLSPSGVRSIPRLIPDVVARGFAGQPLHLALSNG